MFWIFKKKRRERLMKQPFPQSWLEIIERNVPYHRQLPPEDRLELQGLIQVFLAEKQFEGCGGLEMTEEIRVTIAAQACILLLHRTTDFYPNLVSILVYPDIFTAPVHGRDPIGAVSDDVEEYTGESWDRGVVVLSWNDVVMDAKDIHDGYNVVFHEFAHQLDDENGSDDGVPLLPDESMYESWNRVFNREYRRLVGSIGRRRTFLDRYGADSPAEFFAVVTEYFFEMPIELERRHPELYGELRKFYRQDPASFFEPKSGDTP